MGPEVWLILLFPPPGVLRGVVNTVIPSSCGSGKSVQHCYSLLLWVLGGMLLASFPLPFHCWACFRTSSVLTFLTVMRESGGYNPEVLSHCWSVLTTRFTVGHAFLLPFSPVLHLLVRNVPVRRSCVEVRRGGEQTETPETGETGRILLIIVLTHGLYPRV